MSSRLLLIIVAGLFALWPAAAHAGDKARRPNIIVILADDLGYGDLGCYGHPRFKTPHLDKMAAGGTRFTQFNTPMAFCAPTRASLLTGRYPSRCGMPGNPAPDGGPQADKIALPATEVLLGQQLKRAGYATGMVGKWHLGHSHLAFYPTQRGFDDYLGILYSNDMRPVRLIQGEKVAEYPLVQATLTQRYTDWALDFMTRHKGQPFFLYFAHAMPHKPLAVSEKFYKKSGAGLYGDVLAELDDSVGRLLAKLQELGLDDDTLVIFTSDNGPWYGGSAGGLRGMKGTTWEGGYRVPCIVRWPGHVPAGKTTDAIATTPDLFPTALAAAGVAAPKDVTLDGRSLLPLLSGKTASVHEAIFSHQGDKIASVRDVRWKLHLTAGKDRKETKPGVKWIDPRGPDGVTILAPYEQAQPEEYPGLRTGDPTRPGSLFDLSKDAGEQRDVAAQHPEVVARLTKLREQYLASLAVKHAKVEAPAFPTAFSPSGQRVATAKDKAISIFEAQTGKELIRIMGHAAEITALAYSPDDKLLASAASDKSVCVWDAGVGRLLQKIMIAAPARVLFFRPDGKVLTTRDVQGVERDLDLATGAVIQRK